MSVVYQKEHSDPVNERQNKNAYYVTVKRKVSDDLSQKPTKLIRTELVKMTYES